jgi:hypothetical protein
MLKCCIPVCQRQLSASSVVIGSVVFEKLGIFISSLVFQCIEVGVSLEVLQSVRFEQVRRRFEV